MVTILADSRGLQPFRALVPAKSVHGWPIWAASIGYPTRPYLREKRLAKGMFPWMVCSIKPKACRLFQWA